MARIAINNIDHVTTITHEQMMAVYGGFNWGGLLNNIWNIAKGWLNDNPQQFGFNVGGFDIGIGVNGNGVQLGGRRGGFQFGFGFNW